MPVVPFSRTPVPSVPVKPDDQYILMAAAQMKSEKDKPIANSPPVKS